MVLGEFLWTRYHREAKLSTGSKNRLVNSGQWSLIVLGSNHSCIIWPLGSDSG